MNVSYLQLIRCLDLQDGRGVGVIFHIVSFVSYCQFVSNCQRSHWGLVSTYPGHGYTQVLKENKTASQLMMAEMKRNLWVSPGTRVVFLDFTVYNANLNHWAVVRQTFEFPASGGVVPNNFYTITKLIR